MGAQCAGAGERSMVSHAPRPRVSSKLTNISAAGGGSGLQACSGDVLMEALVASAGLTMKAVGFQAIRLRVDLDADMPTDQVAMLVKLVKLIERCGVMFQILAQPPMLSVTRRIGCLNGIAALRRVVVEGR